MTDAYFSRMLEEIYSNFGRVAPAIGSPMYRNLHRRLCEDKATSIPDEAAQEISYAFSEYDSLPQNLGKAIREEYANWRRKHPEKVVKRSCCPQCDINAPGWCYVHDAQGKNYLLRCTCNADFDPNSMPAPVATKEYLQQAGLTRGKIINPADPDGVNATYSFLSAEKKQQLIESLALGKRFKPRGEHLSAREDAGVPAFEQYSVF